MRDARLDLATMMASEMASSRDRAIIEAAKIDLSGPITIPTSNQVRRWIDWIASARSETVALRRWRTVRDHRMAGIAEAQRLIWAARWAYARACYCKEPGCSVCMRRAGRS